MSNKLEPCGINRCTEPTFREGPQLSCRRHWFALPATLRAAILREWRKDAKSDEYRKAEAAVTDWWKANLKPAPKKRAGT